MTSGAVIKAIPTIAAAVKGVQSILASGHRRVLLVEDDANDILLFECCYKNAKIPHVLTVARNAEGALALINRNHNSVVFLDLRLTHMPGWRFVPMIRNVSKETQIVILCGHYLDIPNITATDAVFTVIHKPITEEKLREVFRKLRLA